jgi:hypothetical protein
LLLACRSTTGKVVDGTLESLQAIFLHNWLPHETPFIPKFVEVKRERGVSTIGALFSRSHQRTPSATSEDRMTPPPSTASALRSTLIESVCAITDLGTEAQFVSLAQVLLNAVCPDSGDGVDGPDFCRCVKRLIGLATLGNATVQSVVDSALGRCCRHVLSVGKDLAAVTSLCGKMLFNGVDKLPGASSTAAYLVSSNAAPADDTTTKGVAQCVTTLNLLLQLLVNGSTALRAWNRCRR